MKKVVLLSERLPYPPTSGTKNLLYNYCKILHEKLGLEVVNISFLEQDEETSARPEFIARTYLLPNPSGVTKIKNIICKTLLQRKYPLQVSLFWDIKIKRRIEQIIDREKPDYVIADFVRTTEYLKDYKGYKIADLQDLLSLRYERQMHVDLKTINPYGAYFFRMPKAVQAILQQSFVKKLVMKTETELLKNFEENVGKNYNRIMFVAKSEGAILDDLIGEKKSLIAPLGVDYNYFSQDLRLIKKDKSIAFMGALNVAHNENGIIHFITHCFPEVRKRVPKATLHIIGGGASERLKQYASEHIIITGRVVDVRVAIGECEVFICPLQFGSGIKTKNIEAMAMGMPVVTTSIGAESIEARNQDEWIVADTDEKFSEAVAELLTADPASRKKMGCAAQSFVRNKFTWSVAEQAFREVFNNE